MNLYNNILKFFPSLFGGWYPSPGIRTAKWSRRSGSPLGANELDLKLRSKHS